MLEHYHLRTRKKLGQHYLTDPHVLGKILQVSDLSPADFVLEIGPGIGAVTQALAGKAGHVCAVELDAALVPVLRDIFENAHHVEIHHGDILKIDINALLEPYADLVPKVVANLPYYVTTPVLMHLLESALPFKTITVMVQREVAERMAAEPGSKDYGSLSLAVRYYADTFIAAYVPPNCFTPRPHVDSAVIHLNVLPQPRYSVDKQRLFEVIHAAFSQRRKTLVNCITAQRWNTLSKEDLANVLRQCGYSENIRGETLNLEQMANLTEALSAAGAWKEISTP